MLLAFSAIRAFPPGRRGSTLREIKDRKEKTGAAKKKPLPTKKEYRYQPNQTNFPQCRCTAGTSDDGKPIPKIVRERTKSAYRFLMEEHDPESCDLCSGKAAAPSDFYNGLFHYILENGRLTDEQYGCIEKKVEARSHRL
ncbi:hypothetical protein AKJ40_00915 [candidate division MSBL1 archaeon SCGC-AAA259M10]|uniref:Uncharacterized protein n=1 Tax=candidate division MSBL1 archaeon SCGC-AAA259M10 TaxID=1698270 RepID=A0A133V2M0_9EURY|nr:hypothetical protein AKJ40_00915 [candidate division MSBL1 archaeon SCGC-AAA259M10]